MSWVQMPQMSSKNLKYANGFKWKDAKALCSQEAIHILAYDGANVLPIAVPFIYRLNFESNSKSFFVRFISNSFKMYLSGLLGSGKLTIQSFTAFMPSVVSIFVYKLSISIVNKRESVGTIIFFVF